MEHTYLALQTVVGEGLLRECYGDFPPHPIFLLECSVFVWKDGVQVPIVQLFKIVMEYFIAIILCGIITISLHGLVPYCAAVQNNCGKY